jgi:predicted acylesterase/phospholipase RssA
MANSTPRMALIRVKTLALMMSATLRDARDGWESSSGWGERSRVVSAALSRARAVRESQLLWIPAAGLESLATSAPRAFAALAWRAGARAGAARERRGGGFSTRARARKTTDASSGERLPLPDGSDEFGSEFESDSEFEDFPEAPRTVAVIPVSEGAALALDSFCASVSSALSASCASRVADSASRLAEVGQAGVGALAAEATAHWIAQLEAANDVVLLKADPFPSPWCAQCARHADVVLLVASSEDPPPTAEEGRRLQARLLGGGPNGGGGGLAQRELVLLHGSAAFAPTGTRVWLEAFSVHRHHHVARAPAHGLAPAHASRLARSLRGHSVGLVLAGGGARGFAHVGVLMALEEEGIPVDMLGGTSMGSFVGGVYAKEPTALLTRIIARRLAVHMSSTWEQLLDLTVPVVSYFSGFRMNRALEPLFRGARIEDCWLPFFCMTLDLLSCAPIAHRDGMLWRYVRASMALVGFLPPVCDRVPPGGRIEPGSRARVLVDGGYVNNLPTDVMRRSGARIIIAVDVSGRGLPESTMRPWGDAISGASIFLRNWLPKWCAGGPSCPTMAQMQSHLPFVTDYANAARRVGTVDIMVRPAVADVPILAFGRYAEIVRAGHEAGLRAVRAWKLANPEAAPLLDDGLWRPAWGAAAAGAGAARGGQDRNPTAMRRGGGVPSADALDQKMEAFRTARTVSPRAARGADEEEDEDEDVSFLDDGGKRKDAAAAAAAAALKKKSRSRRRGFAEWFRGVEEEDDDNEGAFHDVDDVDDVDVDVDDDDDDDETSSGRAEGVDPYPGRGNPRSVFGNRAGFFSPDQPAPSMRQRHRYNSFQSGLDGDAFHHPHS